MMNINGGHFFQPQQAPMMYQYHMSPYVPSYTGFHYDAAMSMSSPYRYEQSVNPEAAGAPAPLNNMFGEENTDGCFIM